MSARARLPAGPFARSVARDPHIPARGCLPQLTYYQLVNPSSAYPQLTMIVESSRLALPYSSWPVSTS